MAAALAAAMSLMTAGCPKEGMAVRMWNRSGRQIGAFWQDKHRVALRDGGSAVIGHVTADPDATYSIGVQDWASILAYDDIPASVFTDAATRPAGAGGAKEFCVEFGPDQIVYALDGKTLRRLSPQPEGFPLHPSELK